MAAGTALEVAPDVAERERHRLIIAAAVAAVAGGRARIRQVREIRGPASTAWTRQGRAEIQGSHELAASPVRSRSDWCRDQELRLRIRGEDGDYDVTVEFIDDVPVSNRNEQEAKKRIPAAVVRERPPQKFPEDQFGRSPIAGRVTAVLVPEGTRVRKDEPVILIEAMKMEIKVGPVVDGVVEAIRVKPGETVTSGRVLFELS